MEQWKRLIDTGNCFFNEGSWVEAREQYLQALALAQVLFERWRDADTAVAAYVVSQHNLADLNLKLGHPEDALGHLCSCHEFLLSSISNETLSPALREAALHHSSRTYSCLLRFTMEHGTYPRSDGLLGRNPGETSLAACSTPAIRQYH